MNTNGDLVSTEPVNPFGESLPGVRSMALSGADPAIVAAAETAKMQIQMAYFMATQSPRRPREAWQKIIDECGRPAFARSAVYRKPVGGGTVEGPSVRLAEAIIRHWGNIMARTQVVYEDEESRRVLVQVIDLETNATYSKEIVTTKTVERKSKADREVVAERKNSNGQTVYVVRATDDEVHNKEASSISKTIRNEGLRFIPADVIEDAVKKAKATIHSNVSQDRDANVKEMISGFGAIGVQVRELERWLGHGIDSVTAKEISSLVAVFQSVRDGETTWAEVMEERTRSDDSDGARSATESQAADLKARLAAAQDAETEEEQDDFDLMDVTDLATYVRHTSAQVNDDEVKAAALKAIKSKDATQLRKVARELAAAAKDES